jgi:hypothetical protein
VAARVAFGDQDRQLEQLTEAGRPSSRNVVSATSTLPRSQVLLKIDRGCPVAVSAAFPGSERQRRA